MAGALYLQSFKHVFAVLFLASYAIRIIMIKNSTILDGANLYVSIQKAVIMPIMDYQPKQRVEGSSMRTLLTNIFDKNLVEVFGSSTHHVGPSSIKDLPCQRIIDIIVCTKDVLPTIPPDIVSQMKQLGYRYIGPNPKILDKGVS